MCFVLFLFETCFGWNFNAIAAAVAAAAYIPLSAAVVVLYFPYLFTIQHTTRLLENPVEATTIVQNFVLLLVENVV
jgi:hypothetical protein